MLPGLIDYTSDDDRTIALKRQGYSNAQVANQMQLEGRKRTSNSVNNRWIRLRKALTEREEELLDDELSDWHADEVGIHCTSTRLGWAKANKNCRTTSYTRPIC